MRVHTKSPATSSRRLLQEPLPEKSHTMTVDVWFAGEDTEGRRYSCGRHTPNLHQHETDGHIRHAFNPPLGHSSKNDACASTQSLLGALMFHVMHHEYIAGPQRAAHWEQRPGKCTKRVPPRRYNKAWPCLCPKHKDRDPVECSMIILRFSRCVRDDL